MDVAKEPLSSRYAWVADRLNLLPKLSSYWNRDSVGKSHIFWRAEEFRVGNLAEPAPFARPTQHRVRCRHIPFPIGGPIGHRWTKTRCGRLE
jgi:hypothetical protein